MRKFSILKLRKNLTQEDITNALFIISKSNSQNVLVTRNRNLLCDVIYELKNDHVNRKEILDSWLKCQDISPPLELLWIFDEEKLLKITTYLYFHREYCGMINDFLSITLGSQEDVNESDQLLAKKILSKVISNILILRNNNDFKFLYEEIIHYFVSEAVLNFHSGSLDWNYFIDLKDNGSINDALKEFSLLHLEKFLNCDSNDNNMAFVIGNHTRLWSSGKLSEQSKSFIKGFISVINPHTVLTEINNVVRQGSFSWKSMLLMIAIFVQEQKNAELMKGKVDRWLVSAIEEKDKSLLYISLIVARHCCHEKARYFVNYPTWFGSLSLKTVASFSFFFDCLSQIVPDEPPLYLKIHINKVPSAPTSCQRKILDYLALAKTRLSDLNETTDYIGLFNDYHETDEEGQESDIQRAIKLYQETKEIPKALLEASVFRRQYYEKTFLKRLLSLSQNEDEQRAELIKKLYSSGKIPSTLYRSWSSRSLKFTL